MLENDQYERDLTVEYCLFEGSLARLWFDNDADEYTDGEILDDNGKWVACPTYEILSEGESITDEEAAEYAMALGVTIPDAQQ